MITLKPCPPSQVYKYAKRHEQAALNAWCKAAEAAEKKEKKLAKKEARDRKKRDEKLRKVPIEEPDNDEKGVKLGATNVNFICFTNK